MGYTIDVSFDLRKKKSVSNTRSMITDLAYTFNCSSVYDNYEFEGRRHTVYRSSCVLIIEFNDECESDFENILNFLKSLKLIKNIYIESIYCDSPAHFVYTSSKYQNMMENKKISELNRKRKRERLYSDEDLLVLEAISKH